MFELLGFLGLLVFVALGVFASEVDSALLACATFFIGMLTLEFGFGIGVWAIITSNPLWAVGFVLLYVCAGATYTGLWRWPEYIRNNKQEIESSYAAWKRSGPSTDSSFAAYMESTGYVFSAARHKERLGTWVGLWPFSLSWELSRKPAIWIWNTMYTSLGNTFDRIGKNTARKLHDKE